MENRQFPTPERDNNALNENLRSSCKKSTVVQFELNSKSSRRIFITQLTLQSTINEVSRRSPARIISNPSQVLIKKINFDRVAAGNPPARTESFIFTVVVFHENSAPRWALEANERSGNDEIALAITSSNTFRKISRLRKKKERDGEAIAASKVGSFRGTQEPAETARNNIEVILFWRALGFLSRGSRRDSWKVLNQKFRTRPRSGTDGIQEVRATFASRARRIKQTRIRGPFSSLRPVAMPPAASTRRLHYRGIGCIHSNSQLLEHRTASATYTQAQNSRVAGESFIGSRRNN